MIFIGDAIPTMRRDRTMKKKLLVLLIVLVAVIGSGLVVGIRPMRGPYPPPGGGGGGRAVTVEFTL